MSRQGSYSSRVCRQKRLRTRLVLELMQHGRCLYCGMRPRRSRLEIDHRVPLAKGGTDGLDNLALACGPCNRRKGDGPPPPAGSWKRAPRPRKTPPRAR